MSHQPWYWPYLTNWGRVTHIWIGNLTIIGSDNGLSPGRRQAVIWTNAGILLIGPLGTNFSEMLIAIHAFSFKKMHLKMSSVKWQPFCLRFNVLRYSGPCLPWRFQLSVPSPCPWMTEDANIYTPAQRSWRYWIHLVRPSVRPSFLFPPNDSIQWLAEYVLLQPICGSYGRSQ